MTEPGEDKHLRVARTARERANGGNAMTASQFTSPSQTEVDASPSADGEAIFHLDDVSVAYNGNLAVRDISFDILEQRITALIGPSGCGKSTLLRCLNRMNDLIPAASVEGTLLFHGEDLYAPQVDPVQVRKRIGMVFQKPNPFPKTIYENIAFGPRVLGMEGDMDQIVESALKRGALWDEVKDRLRTNAFGLSGGQQQRLCIARALAADPEVLLLDEPCSALDPRSTSVIEELILRLREEVAIVIVTHNMQQALRIADHVGFMYLGELVEYGPADQVFGRPTEQRTREYVGGGFG